MVQTVFGRQDYRGVAEDHAGQNVEEGRASAGEFCSKGEAKEEATGGAVPEVFD